VWGLIFFLWGLFVVSICEVSVFVLDLFCLFVFFSCFVEDVVRIVFPRCFLMFVGVVGICVMFVDCFTFFLFLFVVLFLFLLLCVLSWFSGCFVLCFRWVWFFRC
jgi:hypothetical protein